MTDTYLIQDEADENLFHARSGVDFMDAVGEFATKALSTERSLSMEFNCRIVTSNDIRVALGNYVPYLVFYKELSDNDKRSVDELVNHVRAIVFDW